MIGLIPLTLETLLNERRNVRKKMEVLEAEGKQYSSEVFFFLFFHLSTS